MNKTTLVILFALSVVASFCAGAFVGADTYFTANSPHRATVVAGEIDMLKRGSHEPLRKMLQWELEANIEEYGNYNAFVARWLHPGLYNPEQVEEGMRYASCVAQANTPKEGHSENVLQVLEKYPCVGA